MPNGSCHSAATIATTSAFLSYYMAGVVVTSYSISEWNEWAGWAAIGAFMGLVIEPDLDQDANAAPLGTMRKTGVWLADFWKWYWTPYAKFLPHRSPFSHWPIIGTFGRVLYLLPIFIVPVILWTHFFGFPKAQIFSWFVGLAWADTLHFIMDFWIPRRFFPQNYYKK